MPKYEVECYRTVCDILRQTVEVDADSVEEAEAKGLKLAQEKDEWLFWQCGDTQGDDEADAREIKDQKQ